MAGTRGSRTRALCNPSKTPRANSVGVESAFASDSEPFASSNTTTSVKVPPISTAARKFVSFPCKNVRQCLVQNVRIIQPMQTVRSESPKRFELLERFELIPIASRIDDWPDTRSAIDSRLHRWPEWCSIADPTHREHPPEPPLATRRQPGDAQRRNVLES